MANVAEALKKHIISETQRYRNSGGAKPSDDRKVARDVGYLVRKFRDLSNSQNAVMKKHIDGIAGTKGDYSRRNPKILEKVSYMAGFAQDLLTKDAELEYTTIGLFARVYKILRTPQFILATRKAYENLAPTGAQTSGSFYGALYTSFVLFLETVTMQMIPYEFQFSKGMNPKALAAEMEQDHKAFTQSVCFGIASLATYIESQKAPVTTVMKAVEEEKTKIETSKESVAFTVLTVAVIAVGSVIGLFLIRQMFYWFANFKIDVAHFLEFEAELLTNNIRNLRAQYDAEKDVEKKKKLATMIEKQEEWVENFNKWSKSVLSEEVKATYETNEEIQTEEETNPSKQEAGTPEVFL